jgi:glycerol-3-phosphate dehydrogenase (NAD(P)+)
MQMKEKILVLGAGGWGTTLAILLAHKGFKVDLWEPFPHLAEELRQRRENVKFLPGVPIPLEINITSHLEEAAPEKDIIVVVLRSHFVRKGVHRLAQCRIPPHAVIVSASKGIENKSNLRMSQVIASELPNNRIAVLSGPSFAVEVSRNVPTLVVIATPDEDLAKYIQNIFMASNFKLYTNPDIIGVELGGALKNIIAIAAGICDGLGLGDNTKAALMARGLAEIARLGIAMGANPLTFAGLSGLGDLITTCTSKNSRNRGLGEALGKGRALKEILKGMTMVAEGVQATKSAYQLSKRYKVKMPIVTAVYGVLFKGEAPQSVVANLMTQEAEPEQQQYLWG